MADRDSDGSYRDIHEQVYLTGLQSRSWLDEQAPLCLLPPMFSRFDHPVMYCYRDPPVHRIGYEKALPKLDPNVIGICTFTCSVVMLKNRPTLFFCLCTHFVFDFTYVVCLLL